MIETSLVAGQLAEGATQQQSLPSAQQKDVSRFQDLMTGNGVQSDTSIQPQSVDSSSVLQITEPGKAAEEGGLVDSLINQATKIDSTYHSLIEQMANRPSIDDYFSPRSSTTDTNEMMTYPNVPVNMDGETAAGSNMDSMLDSMRENSQASLAYQSDMNNWAMSFRMWSAGVEVVSAAASKVSQGFQTLFRASG
ncbi:MAG: hypothetical protein ACPGVP_00855 [Thiolinea sp.]